MIRLRDEAVQGNRSLVQSMQPSSSESNTLFQMYPLWTIGHLVNMCRFAIQNKAVANPADAQPTARKPYAGTAPICNKCNAHNLAYLQCRLCASCGRLGHLANVFRLNPSQGGPNQPQVNPARMIDLTYVVPNFQILLHMSPWHI
ncbi:hypothetical protein Hanom_Chr06g00522161 [Helianthus anomalus]